jgi:polygalacturonase
VSEAEGAIAGISRRGLLHRLAGVVAFLLVGRTATAKVGGTADVRRFGARGDGRSDDTRAFQDAIDSLRGGGIVTVPPGDYVIDPLTSVHLRSGIHLRLAHSARLHAKPNDAERAYVLTLQDVSDASITGGRLIGDRDRHLGRTGEWGHGIALRGAQRVEIRDMHISRCWGDGISVGSAKRPHGQRPQPSVDIEIANVTCVGNRRQGLTIGRSRRVYVHDSEFSDTGGTPPAAGIDVEPDGPEWARDARIERCTMRRNRGPGIQVWKLTQGITIRDCLIEDNRNAGILANGARDLAIQGNRIRGNGSTGVALRNGTQDVAIAGNTFARNAPGRPRASRGGRDPRWARHLDVAADVGGLRVAPDNHLD